MTELNEMNETITTIAGEFGTYRHYRDNSLFCISYGSMTSDWSYTEQYHDGLAHGAYVSRHFGRLHTTFTYIHGLKHGWQTEYDDNGVVCLEVHYHYGRAEPNVLVYGKYEHQPWRFNNSCRRWIKDHWLGNMDLYIFNQQFENSARDVTKIQSSHLKFIMPRSFDNAVINALTYCLVHRLPVSHMHALLTMYKENVGSMTLYLFDIYMHLCEYYKDSKFHTEFIEQIYTNLH